MKPTHEQCTLAIEIGAALVHQAGRAATDLIRAGQAGSPILDKRLQNALDAARNVSADVASLVQRFYAMARDEADTDDNRTESLRIRLSVEEKAELQRQAEEAGETVSAYIRRSLNL